MELPVNPVTGRKYEINGRIFRYAGDNVYQAIQPRETDPIYQQEKVDIVFKKQLENYLRKDEFDFNILQTKPAYVIEKKRSEISFHGDYISIPFLDIKSDSNGDDAYRHKIIPRNLYVKIDDFFLETDPLVAYPYFRGNTNVVNMENCIYLKDVQGLISKNSNFEGFKFSFDLDVLEFTKDFLYGGNLPIRKNAIILDESQLDHSLDMVKVIHSIYKGRREIVNSRTDINTSVNDKLQPYYYYKKQANISTRPYSNGAVNESHGKNGYILKACAHYNNSPKRRDITNAPNEFLEVIAVSAKYTNTANVDTPTTTYFQSSYGYGVEFFIPYEKQIIDTLFPSKNIEERFKITAIDVAAKEIILSGKAWGSRESLCFAGDEVLLLYPDGTEQHVAIESVVNDVKFKLTETPNALPASGATYLVQKVTVGCFMHYTPQQSPTCNIVAAQAAMIQDATSAENALVREAMRMTASNSTVTTVDGKKVYEKHWDMFRGFGYPRVDLAIEYIRDNYIDDREWKDSVVNAYPKGNSLISHSDLLSENYVTAEMLRRLASVVLRRNNRNLLLDSSRIVENSAYLIAQYHLAIKPKAGERYKISIWGSLGDDKSRFLVYNSGGSTQIEYFLKRQENNFYDAEFAWVDNGINTYLNIYAYPNSGSSQSIIRKIKLEKVEDDWLPAPEDLGIKID